MTNDPVAGVLMTTTQLAGEAIVTATPYEQAFNRIHAEFVEMPGMRLTPAQVERLSGVSSSVCRVVLDDLVRARFLSVGEKGTYLRTTGVDRDRPATPARSRSAIPSAR